MSNAVVAATLGNAVPAASLGQIVASLIDMNGVMQDHQGVDAAADAVSATVTFMNVAPGTYTVTAARLDASGASVAPAIVSAPFTVAAPSNVTVPISVSVSVA